MKNIIHFLRNGRLSDLLHRQAQEMAAKIDEHSYWFVFEGDKKSVLPNTLGLFNSRTGRFVSASVFHGFVEFLGKKSFLKILSEEKENIIFDVQTRLMWGQPFPEKYSGGYIKAKFKLAVEFKQYFHLENWRLPTLGELKIFAQHSENPGRCFTLDALSDKNGYPQKIWTHEQGCVDISNWNEVDSLAAKIFACNDYFVGEKSILNWALIVWLIEKNFRVDGFDFKKIQPWKEQSLEQRLQSWAEKKLSFIPMLEINKKSPFILKTEDFMLDPELFVDIDFTPCRLPRITLDQMADPQFGLWELWGQDEKAVRASGVVARNPVLDLQKNRSVAIDFGTSSTVVAIQSATGNKPKVLRMGLSNRFEPVQPRHYENPTVLECNDYREFAKVWFDPQQVQRPNLDWRWMCASHEAQDNFRAKLSDHKELSRFLPRLKQWALRGSDDAPMRLSDSKGYDEELPQHEERNPVLGQQMTIDADYPFDPIELYAWYLGMEINQRDEGLFLRYYLSFPVKYPKEVKDRMLASIRRGLLRSFPHTLPPEALYDFQVVDLTSEPTAYAASALHYFKIKPTQVGVPYAVFDFGGGTSDFDYGLLRAATPEEEDDEGIDRVIEHIHSEGDNFLGGENLLDHIVYECFRQNLEVLRNKHIQISKPMDLDRFPGSEQIVPTKPTRAAITNSIMLAGKLRAFMEVADLEQARNTLGEDGISIDLIDIAGKPQPCDLQVDVDALDAVLATRMKRGARTFFQELARVVRGEFQVGFAPGQPIQVLLAGNGSRSRHIKALFDKDGALYQQLMTEAFGDPDRDGAHWPELHIHSPLPTQDDSNLPSAKTGVALGLLRLVPGSKTRLVNHIHAASDGEAPFAWFVGESRYEVFQPGLHRGAPYAQWVKIGRVTGQPIFELIYTDSPRAKDELPEDSDELKKLVVSFPGAPKGARIWARPLGPNKVELLATEKDAAAPQADQIGAIEMTLK